MTMIHEPQVGHPLEPLSAEEVSAASSILKSEKGLGATARFVFITLHEPPKAAVQAGVAVEGGVGEFGPHRAGREAGQ